MPANPLGVLLRNRRAGEQSLTWHRPELQADASITVTSPAFEHGAPIPERYCGRLRGTNVSPPLEWSAPPPGTEELVLIAEDPDAPTRRPAVHVLTVGIAPSLQSISEGALVHPSPVRGLRHGRAALGRRGYAGPLPVRSHGPHHYVFQLYALDVLLEMPESFSLKDVVAAMQGHVIARGRLDGTYEIR